MRNSVSILTYREYSTRIFIFRFVSTPEKQHIPTLFLWTLCMNNMKAEVVLL